MLYSNHFEIMEITQIYIENCKFQIYNYIETKELIFFRSVITKFVTRRQMKNDTVEIYLQKISEILFSCTRNVSN